MTRFITLRHFRQQPQTVAGVSERVLSVFEQGFVVVQPQFLLLSVHLRFRVYLLALEFSLFQISFNLCNKHH
jgi:hypothetical protein